MKAVYGLAILALPFAAMAPVGASEVNIVSTGPVIDLNVTESVQNIPNVASFSTGVATTAATAREAIRINSGKMSAIIARLKSLGIKGKDIQTSNLSLNKDYDFVNSKRRFKGYRVFNNVSGKLRDMDKLPKLLDAIASDGATDFNGPHFSYEDEGGAKNAARDKAWASAKSLAKYHAAKAGYNNVRVLRVAEQSRNVIIPTPSARFAMAEAADAGSSTPIEQGEVATSVSLTVTFEMVK